MSLDTETSFQRQEPPLDPAEFLRELRAQTHLLSEILRGVELDPCLLDKIGRIACLTANEVHKHTLELKAIRESLAALLEISRTAHPGAALELERMAKLRAEVERCCPPEEVCEPICRYQPCERHGGLAVGDGYSRKSRGFINPVQVSDEHEPWSIQPGTLNENQILPRVAQGPIVGQLLPVGSTQRPLDFRSGSLPSGGGQEPVTFRTFTNGSVTTLVWPPDMSGAKGGDVVVMSGNLWLKLSVDGGKTFTDLDFTKVFAANPTYGPWAGDQVIHYVPSIDCFVLYVQSKTGSSPNASKSVVKIALASPGDLKKYAGGKQAWRRQWDFSSDDFGLSAWMDFPDVTYGDAFLYVNTNVFIRSLDSAGNPVLDKEGKFIDNLQGKLFFELPLKELKAGAGFNYQYALIADTISIGSPAQNIGDENYWAAHVNNATMRIYSSKGGDADYFWRERKLKGNWPITTDNNIVSNAPDSPDWLSEDHRIIGATKVGNQLWFAWTAASGDGGAGGFNFPQPHIQIAKFDVSKDYDCVEQTQVWNPDNAYAYPSLTTNSNFEVGISLAWGGGSAYGSHAVGILGDFVVWYGEASDMTSAILSPTRFGDYLHVRLAHPDTRFFSAFGYAVEKDTSTTPASETPQFLYVEFGREAIEPSPLH